MLTHPTIEILLGLGLHGMAKGFKALEQTPEVDSLKHSEWLALLLQYEATLRHQKRFDARIKVARMRYQARVEDVDYRAHRGLDRPLFLKLSSNAKLLRALSRVDLLILDDWGPEVLNNEQRRDLLEIVEDRYNARSLLITSQIPVKQWYDIIGNSTLADAILDRIVHNAYRIELSGDSLRERIDDPIGSREDRQRPNASAAPQPPSPPATPRHDARSLGEA